MSIAEWDSCPYCGSIRYSEEVREHRKECGWRHKHLLKMCYERYHRRRLQYIRLWGWTADVHDLDISRKEGMLVLQAYITWEAISRMELDHVYA